MIDKVLARARKSDLTFRGEVTSYLNHDVHPYPAKFIPNLVEHFLKQFCKPGDVVLDPYLGSGTTFLSAKMLGLSCIGAEANPIGRITSLAKVSAISSTVSEVFVKEHIDLIIKKFSKIPNIKSFADANKYLNNKKLWFPVFENFNLWFRADTFVELAVLLNEIKTIKNPRLRNIALVVFSALIKPVSNARPDERNPKFRKEPREKADLLGAYRRRLERVLRNAAKLYDISPSQKTFYRIASDDARHLKLADNTIDLVVTSPPYANAIDYIRMHKLSLYWLGHGDLLKLDRKIVGTERVYKNEYESFIPFPMRDVEQVMNRLVQIDRKRAYILNKYCLDINQTLKEIYRVLKKGKVALIIIGDSTIRGLRVPTHKWLMEMAKEIGFRKQETICRAIPAEVKAMANVHSDFGGEMVSQEYLLFFQK